MSQRIFGKTRQFNYATLVQDLVMEDSYLQLTCANCLGPVVQSILA